MTWQPVLDGIWLFRDSCNVYAIKGPEGLLFIDSGTGAWLDHVGELDGPPVALALTHNFRDHAAGAVRAAESGIAVYVPEYEREVLADPNQHFRQRSTYIIYDNLWDLFVPIEPLDIAGVLRDYDRLELAGLDVYVLPLPGVTLTQSGLSVTMSERRIVFCGEAIYDGGRLARIAPLQYDYQNLGGAVNCYYSGEKLLEHKPDVLLPSLGPPILRDVDTALNQLKNNLRRLCDGRPDERTAIEQVHADPLKKITNHVWHTTQTESWNWFVISESGKALVIDYGYPMHCVSYPMYSTTGRRRALLHSLEALKDRFGIDRIDTVLVSHFHDDHVCGIPVLQRCFGTQVWAPENFADLLEHPESHCFPCTWPTPISVDRRLPLQEPVQWQEYTFHFAPMNGHTRFSALIGFEADGKKFAHTGDQYFFQEGTGNWANNLIQQNHVYRNGALLDGYAQSGRWLLSWRPDIVLTGHVLPMYTDESFFSLVDDWTRQYEQLHRTTMVLDDDDIHFNLDSWGGWIWPYRVHLTEPGPATVTVTVRNPYPRQIPIHVKLVGQRGWQGEATTVEAKAREEVSCQLSITPDATCRRQPFAVELTADGRPFGQVAEALMTVGHADF